MQSMKRMEELIHLNKKIHFEGKVGILISKAQPARNLGGALSRLESDSWPLQ